MSQCGPHTPTSVCHLWTQGSPSWTTYRPGGCRHMQRLWAYTAGKRWWGANCRWRQETKGYGWVKGCFIVLINIYRIHFGPFTTRLFNIQLNKIQSSRHYWQNLFSQHIHTALPHRPETSKKTYVCYVMSYMFEWETYDI